MIHHGPARVLSTEQIYPGTFVTWYEGNDFCRAAYPGQFVMVQPREGMDPFLPRAFSFYRFRGEGERREFALLYTVVGEATALMAAQERDDQMLMTGPLGQGFDVRPGAGNLLLTGGGVGMAPLVALAEQELARGQTIVVCCGASTAERVYPAALLPPEVEYAVATDDGSLGKKGFVTDVFAEYLPWANQSMACGPVPMFRSMAGVVRREGMRRSVQILMETEMACGTGICYGCAVFTRKGVRLCCKDGPRFELLDVF